MEFVAFECPDGTTLLLCKLDSDVFQTCFNYMKPNELVERIKRDKVVKDFWNEAKKNFKKPELITFPRERVDMLGENYMKIKRKVNIVNQAEWVRFFNCQPLKKHTRFIPTMQVASQDTEDVETVWVFRGTLGPLAEPSRS